jgi:stage II sporulation protein R
LEELEDAARAELIANGFDDEVSVTVTDQWFPTRVYDSFSLPAGQYRALKVTIGDGMGQNWWCVVFPPLCTAAVSEVPEVAVSAGLSGAQVRLITEEDGYVLKFKCAELWQQLRTALGK